MIIIFIKILCKLDQVGMQIWPNILKMDNEKRAIYIHFRLQKNKMSIMIYFKIWITNKMDIGWILSLNFKILNNFQWKLLGLFQRPTSLWLPLDFCITGLRTLKTFLSLSCSIAACKFILLPPKPRPTCFIRKECIQC